MAEFKLEEIGKFVKQMNLLEEKVQGRVAWGATKAGANVIRDNARKNASRIDNPASPQDIEENIVAQRATKLAKSEKACAYRVGVLGGAKTPRSKKDAEGQSNPGGATFYWRFLEFGTSKMKAQPFLRPAASESVSEVYNTVAKVFWKRMEKELAKLK